MAAPDDLSDITGTLSVGLVLFLALFFPSLLMGRVLPDWSQPVDIVPQSHLVVAR